MSEGPVRNHKTIGSVYKTKNRIYQIEFLLGLKLGLLRLKIE